MSQKFTHPQGCKMSSPTKSGSQPCGWQIASSRDSFCDFGRKLENLSVPANTQRCAATDGSTNPGRATDGSSGVLASAFHNLPQGHLEFLIPAQRNPSRKPQPPTPHQPANPATPLPQKKQSHPCPAFSFPHLNSGTPQ